jgi:hypothetical protein
LEEDWEPVEDFLDNDHAFTEAMRETFEHSYVLVNSLSLNSHAQQSCTTSGIP